VPRGKGSHRAIGIAWVTTSALAYSLFAIFAKRLLDALTPTDVLAWRFLIAAPVAWAIVLVRFRAGGASPRDAPIGRMVLAGVAFGMIALFAFYGVDHLSASLYTVLIYTYPAMVAAGSALLGRPPTRTLWIALGFTVLGIALTVPSVFDGSADADGIGLAYTIGNAALYAVYILATARLLRPGRARADSVVAAAWSLTGSLVFAVGVIALNGLHRPEDWGMALNLAGLAVVSTVVAGMTLLLGLARLGPAPAALVATVEPVLTLIWAVLLLRESLQPIQVAGAALVIAGVMWAQRPSVPILESGAESDHSDVRLPPQIPEERRATGW
jgi:drug/metabolite transporter (DMT)-like permease